MANIKFEYLDNSTIIEVPFSRNPSPARQEYQRRLKYMQPKEFSDGGDIYIYDKGSKEYRSLSWGNCPKEDYASLISFIKNTVIGSKKSFVFRDFDNLYYNVRLMNAEDLVFTPVSMERESFALELLLESLYSPASPTFTRASIAYVSAVQVAAGSPRYKAGKFDQGILIESGVTNLLSANQSSVETDTTGFAAFAGGAISRDTAEDWHGTASLKTITPGSVVNEGFRTSSIGVTASQDYTASVYLKGSGTVRLNLQELDSGDVHIGATSAEDITLLSYWQRFTVTRLFGATGVKARIRVFTVGTAAITFYADGLQLEQREFYTSWQIGDTARVDEALYIPNLGVSNLQEGTIDVWLNVNEASKKTSVTSTILSIQGISDGYIRFLHYTSAYWRLVLSDGTTTKADLVSDGNTPDGWHLFTVTYNKKYGRANLYIDKILYGTISDAVFPSNLTANMYLGSLSTGFMIDAVIDDVRVSSKERTATEISAYDLANPLPVDQWTTYKLAFEDNLNFSRYGS